MALVASVCLMAEVDEGRIRVTVQTPEGLPASGVTVLISSATQIGGTQSVKTGTDGVAQFQRLTPGEFKVEVSFPGFEASAQRLMVKLDQTAIASIRLKPIPAMVVAIEDAADAVDTTSATTGTNFSQRTLESLPIGRNILNALAFVPGVNQIGNGGMVQGSSIGVGSDPVANGSTAVDTLGNYGSRNNTYLLDGMDVTNLLSGTSRIGVPLDIVNEMDVKTYGISPEYSGRSGLFQSVATISGGNEVTGGVSAYYAFASMAAKPGAGKPDLGAPVIRDTTFFISGPIIKDKLWYVASVQGQDEQRRIALTPMVTDIPGEVRNGTDNNTQSIFLKLTAQLTPQQRIFAFYQNDPGYRDNAADAGLVTNRVKRFDTGGDRFAAHYTWTTPSVAWDVKASSNRERTNSGPKYATTGDLGNEVTLFSATHVLTPLQSQFGPPRGGMRYETREDNIGVSAMIPFSVGSTSHLFKVGVERVKTTTREFDTVPGGVFYDNQAEVMTYDDLMANLPSSMAYGDRFGIANSINANPDLYSNAFAALDTNHDGIVTDREVGAYTFGTLMDPANPALGYLGARRRIDPSANINKSYIKAQNAYINDAISFGRFSVNLGVRAQSTQVESASGSVNYKFKTEFAPRLSVVCDPIGDASMKVYGFYGRYVEGIRGDTLRQITGSQIPGQYDEVNIAGDWVNAGQRNNMDAILVDGTRLPRTDDFRIGMEKRFALGRSHYGVSLSFGYRRDSEILGLIASQMSDPNFIENEIRLAFNLGYGALPADQQAFVNYARSLVYPVSAFAGNGASGADNIANRTYFTANMPGTKREHRLADLVIFKEMGEGGRAWQISYSHTHSTGNTIYQGDADLAGYYPEYDARMPYMSGNIDGSMDWNLKGYVTQKFGTSTLVTLTALFDSGIHYSHMASDSFGSYPDLPSIDNVYNWKRGQFKGPGRREFGLHAEHNLKISKVKATGMVDVFNLLNDQRGIVNAEGATARPGYAAHTPYVFQAPRSLALGVKFTF
jgi:hypothetical protein